MSKFSIKADVRELNGRKTNQLRDQGVIPAIMYGFETEPTSIALDRNAFDKLNNQAGSSSIIELEIAGVMSPVLIQDMQRDPLTDFVTHVDFRKIDMSKKVETTISISLEGVSPAVKDQGGTLVQSLEEVDVLSLPSALVREFVLDIGALKTFDDSLHVRDINVPEGLEILTDSERTVALVQAPRTEAEMEKLDQVIEDTVAVEGDVDGEGEEKVGDDASVEKNKGEQKGK